MVIDIKTLISGTPEELSAEIQMLPYPAILLDGKLKIISRNLFASQYISGLKARMLIRRFVSPGDYLVLAEMTAGQTVYIELIGDNVRYGATAFASEESRIIVMHPLGTGIHRRLKQLYDRMSGYDFGITSPYETEIRDVPLKSKTAELFIRRFEEMRSLHTLPFFNPASVLNKLSTELSRFVPDIDTRIVCKSGGDELIVCGSEQDFALLLGVLISLCMNNTDSIIKMAVTEDFDDAVFTLCVNADEAFCATVRTALTGISAESVAEDHLSFNMYLLKLIADGNLWGICIDSDTSGALRISLNARISEPFGGILLRDVSEKYLREILETLFL